MNPCPVAMLSKSSAADLQDIGNSERHIVLRYEREVRIAFCTPG